MDQVEKSKDFGSGEAGEAKRWHKEKELYYKSAKDWHERGRKIKKRYRDERDSATEGDKKFNILWSNVQTLKPSLISQAPNAEIARANKDKDPVGRSSAMILERATQGAIDCVPLEDEIKAAVLDYLLVGRGTAWVRFTADISDSEVRNERCIPEFVNWQDFLHNPARNWREVTWVGRRVFMTRDKLVSRFGDIGKNVPLDFKPAGLDESTVTPEQEAFKKTTVYEIWDSESRMVYWIAEGLKDKLLDKKPPLMDLKNFFPCPKPLYATTDNESLIPVPDFAIYQDQADELDNITVRINLLSDALRVAGVYDSEQSDKLKNLVRGGDNELIPVDSWAAFAEKGGLKGVMDFLPLDTIITVLTGLVELRDKIKQDLYEVTGISDILRGASDPNETYGAQRLKGQFGAQRLGERQSDVQKFARDIIRIMAEIIAENYSDETIMEMVGLTGDFSAIGLVPPMDQNAMPDYQQQGMRLVQESLALLRDDYKRGYRIDIETDSTVAADEQFEKETRIEFLNAVTGFMEKALPAGERYPSLGPLLGEMLMFGIRGFKAGRGLEDAFEKAMDEMGKQPPQPNPEVEKAKAEQALQAQRLQMDKQKQQAEIQLDRVELASDIQLDREKMMAEIQLARERNAVENRSEPSG